MNCHRQSVVSLKLESRAHCCQRLRHALHRSSAQACIALKTRSEWTRSRHTRHETRGRSTVSTLKRETRLMKSAESISLYGDLICQRRYLCTKRSQNARGRLDIRGLQYPANPRLAITESAANERAM